MISYHQGDLFQSGVGALAHGCNCMGFMGAGIAAQFRSRWPAMYRAYQARCHANDFLPGDVMTWEPSLKGEPYVFNLATQMRTGPEARTWMITAAVGAMIHTAIYDYGIHDIALPWIGCGIGGLTREDLNLCLRPYQDTHVNLRLYELA